MLKRGPAATLAATAAIRRRAAPMLAGTTLLSATVLVAVILMTLVRLVPQVGLPLWLDETWTATIAGRATWADFAHEAWLDCNPPLYYAVMKLWVSVAGPSNIALRLPSFAFMILAAALPLALPVRGLSRATRLTWAALLFCWWPGLAITLDARCYTMLLAISVMQTILHVALLQQPSLRRALAWTICAALAILTHYYAVAIVAAQGLVYLHVHRGRTVRTWPALLAFVPTLAWMLHHAPRLAQYARPDVAWYLPVDAYALSEFLAYLFGMQTTRFAIIAGAGIVLLWWSIRYRPDPVRDEVGAIDPAIRWSVTAALGSVAFAIALAVVKPTLSDRYLTPAVPAMLLGLVLCIRHIRGTHRAFAVLVTVFWLGSAAPYTLTQNLSNRATYGYERSSSYLAAARPETLVFAWDHPATKIMARESLDRIGGYFLRRDGVPVTVVPVTLRLGEDPSPRLLAAATGARPAILWLYDSRHGSVAGRDSFAVERQPGWQCRHWRQRWVGVVACAPARLFNGPDAPRR
ncbi:glycosyltransferase family 39 protein [Sphingomonas sp. RB3P16]|uniref:glycosyltransferase family 39 protein n=1 Tax=Parasphingomonas frigoris TaxID=3096163 RepID=UPI002FC59008